MLPYPFHPTKKIQKLKCIEAQKIRENKKIEHKGIKALVLLECNEECNKIREERKRKLEEEEEAARARNKLAIGESIQEDNRFEKKVKILSHYNC
jgi:hypothetical protein